MKRIVVGVDGSAPGRAALDWAIEEARSRGAILEVVHAWTVPANDPYLPRLQGDEVFRRSAAAVLAGEVAHADKVAAGGPTVVPTLVQGSAAAALIGASELADLLVVGSHGHGALSGVLLGSVTQRVLHRATCPVVVVRVPLAPPPAPVNVRHDRDRTISTGG